MQTMPFSCNVHGHFLLKTLFSSPNHHLVIKKQAELDTIAQRAGITGDPLRNICEIDLKSRDIVLLSSFDCEFSDCYAGVSQIICTAEQIQITVSSYIFPGSLEIGSCPNYQGWLVLSKPKDDRKIVVNFDFREIDLNKEPEFDKVDNVKKLGEKYFWIFPGQTFLSEMSGLPCEKWETTHQFINLSAKKQQAIREYIEFKPKWEFAFQQFEVLHKRVCGSYYGSSI